MDCTVVEITYGREVGQCVAATTALVFDVVQIEPDDPAAAGHGAAMAVARQDLLALAGRDGRGGAPWLGGIE